MKIVNKKLDELKPYENNPRINDEAVDYVANSIAEFGFKVPIVIDKNDVIVAGHTRYKASQQLGLNEIPCIVADDLNDEQIKAYRLADNKVSEKARWDYDLLETELSDILNIDMELFDFEIFDDSGLSDLTYKENERHRTADAYNLSEFNPKRAEGYYDMPILKACNFTPTDLIGFNYMLSSSNKDCGIHFYVDDYQFERIWNQPYEYINRLDEYECVLTPDFSLYTEMPMAMKIWNVYRSRLIGQILQDNGMKVIPTVSWCEEDTFDFCFDGLPHNATLSISTIGIKQSEEAFRLWKNGVDEMIKRLSPKKLLIYGGEVDYDFKDIKVKYYNNHVTENMKKQRSKNDGI